MKSKDFLLAINDTHHLKLAKMGSSIWNRWARTLMNDVKIDSLEVSSLKKNMFKTFLPFNDEEKKEIAIKIGLYDLDQLDINAQFDRIEIDCIFTKFWFPGEVCFHEATFSKYADFTEATFSKDSNFTEATFSKDSNFTDATFSKDSSFINATFSEETVFTKATFSKVTNFSGATFKETDFTKATFSEVACFTDANFGEGAIFTSATFSEGAIFINSSFESTTFFIKTKFNFPPEFHNADFHQDTSFHEAEYKKLMGSERDARAWRTLKLEMNTVHNHDQELKFFRFEMDAKVSILWAQKKYFSWLMISIYKLISNYGTSLLKPTLCLILFGILFAVSYNYIIFSDCTLSYFQSVKNNCLKGLQLSVASALPYMSSSKMTISSLFDGNNMGLFLQTLSIMQGIFSTLMLFLIGLALKHKFSIK